MWFIAYTHVSKTATTSGRIPQTLHNAPIDSVSFMHIDLNHDEAEIAGIKFFWPKLSEGGLILLDDYAFIGHEKQYAAINSLADELGVKVLSTPTGQGLMIKQKS
ncbi:MAG: class I SAM-dependent methyltransferase [Proteobacteria bacterium]|nr:class I SAM-dependent methyltransferase [Pseudomonadota bacterium]MBU1687787.1 class I SAM-dependent methyltransferase [Pseudomonadota bacterium]